MNVRQWVLLGITGLVACAHPISSTRTGEPSAGVSYALPRNLVKVTVVRSGPFTPQQAKDRIAFLRGRQIEDEKGLATPILTPRAREQAASSAGPRAALG